ncbi:amino acid permease-domain-containing protein [Chytriomyces sp. MP71]|nr:amino acid permease-domain-containing protein [Chytriomyces sp. MP71]
MSQPRPKANNRSNRNIAMPTSTDGGTSLPEASSRGLAVKSIRQSSIGRHSSGNSPATWKNNKDEYLKKRMLMPAYANSFHVWGFVVGAVISGEFSGFNTGYVYGLGSMIVAHIFASLLMVCVSLNLTELVTAMPFASGCAAYANAAFNGVVACFIGYAYTFDMVFIGGEVTNFIGAALALLFNTEPRFNILYYLLTILICHLINFYPKVYFNVVTIGSAVSCLMVIIPLIAVAPQIDFSQAFTTMIPLSDGTVIISTDLLPYGFSGVINCFPLALYLLICFESMPCCVEETQEIKTTIPRGMLMANLTILFLSWIALVVCAGMPPGVSLLTAASLPYSDILSNAFNMSNHQAVTLISLPSVFASQLAIYYGVTRYIYGQSRGGYMPPILSLTTSQGAPYTAMIATSFMFTVLSVVLQYSSANDTASTLVTMGTIFALTAYIVQPIVYIRLKIRLPDLPRPFNMKSLGVGVATLNIIIATGALIGMVYLNRMWQLCLAGIAVAYVLMVPFYLLVVRHYLTDSPEKMFIKRQLDSIMRESVRSPSTA